jgi:hypothetical protein
MFKFFSGSVHGTGGSGLLVYALLPIFFIYMAHAFKFCLFDYQVLTLY